jgi:hypothetical protein
MTPFCARTRVTSFCEPTRACSLQRSTINCRIDELNIVMFIVIVRGI